MAKLCSYLQLFTLLLLLVLATGCDPDFPKPIIRNTDVIIEGRVTTDGGATPVTKLWVKLIRDRPLSLDTDEFTALTDANGYYRFKFKANHELNDRTYIIYYNVAKDTYFCPSNYLTIGHLKSADTTMTYHFQLPRKVQIQCVYADPAKARTLELNTVFRFSCGLDSESNRFQNQTGAVSADYTDNPLFVPYNTPVIVVTSGIDRKLSQPVEKRDTITVTQHTGYLHQINF